jgi:hypothetical protein
MIDLRFGTNDKDIGIFDCILRDFMRIERSYFSDPLKRLHSIRRMLVNDYVDILCHRVQCDEITFPFRVWVQQIVCSFALTFEFFA